MSHELARLVPLRAELEAAKTPQQIKLLDAKAKAVLVYAKKIGMGLHEVNKIGRFRIDCMAKAGGILAATVRPRGAGHTRLPDGIDRMQSSRWQAVARVPQAEREAFFARFGSDAWGSIVTGEFKPTATAMAHAEFMYGRIGQPA